MPHLPVRIDASISPRLNLASHQNAVPVLRELTVVNGGDAPLSAVALTLSSEPPFLVPKMWLIDVVGAGQCYLIPELDVALDGAMLGRLTEAEAAAASVVATAGGEPVARRDLPIELLARNQ